MHPLAIAAAVATLMIASLAAAQDVVERQSSRDELGAPQSGPSRPAPSSYRRWTRGQVLPQDDRSAPITDYDSHHLRRPPQGYQWYRCGDQFVLAATGSGMIFEVIDGD